MRRAVYLFILFSTILLAVMCLSFGCEKETPVINKAQANESHIIDFIVSSSSFPQKIRLGQFGDFSSISNNFTNYFSESHNILHQTSQSFYLSAKNINFPNDTVEASIIIDGILKAKTKGIDSIYINYTW